MRRGNRACWLLSLVILVPLSTASGATFRVVLDGSGDFRDIQAALDAASDDDTIMVAAGEYVISCPLWFSSSRDNRENRGLTLRSERGPDHTVIRRTDDGTPVAPFGGSAVVIIGSARAESVLDGFTVTGAPGSPAVVADFSAVVNCVVRGNSEIGISLNGATNGSSRVVSSEITSNGTTGIHCSHFAEIVSSRIAGNSTGVYVDDNAELHLTNSILVGNSWAGLYCGEDDFSRTVAINCTIAANGGPGIKVDDGAVITLTNSIVWGNGQGAITPEQPDMASSAESTIRFSCLENLGSWTGEQNVFSDPLFISPGRYDFDRFSEGGVPDFIVEPGDWRLGSESPGLDTADPKTAPDEDFVGRSRPCGAGPDKGAYESADCDVSFRRGDADSNNQVSISDGIVVFNYLFLGGAEPPCLDAADADDSGILDIADGIRVFNYLFRGGASPPLPGPLECGPDTTPDRLDCSGFNPCSDN